MLEALGLRSLPRQVCVIYSIGVNIVWFADVIPLESLAQCRTVIKRRCEAISHEELLSKLLGFMGLVLSLEDVVDAIELPRFLGDRVPEVMETF
jgi:hypothetical protein